MLLLKKSWKKYRESQAIERGWDQTRQLMTVIVNSRPGKGKRYKPEELVKLSIDKPKKAENVKRKSPDEVAAMFPKNPL